MARAGGLRNPVRRRRREPGDGSAVDVVANDANVVARRTPRQRHLAGAARGHEPRRRGGSGGVEDGRAAGVRDRADVPGRVLGGQLVEVRARCERRVRVGGPGRLRDPIGDRRREARRCTTVQVVTDDADIVGRARPGDVDRVAGGNSRYPARRGRWNRVRNGCGVLVRGRADVAGGVLCGNAVVVGARAEAGVGVAGASRLRDPFAALGVKPAVVPRWTLYRATPTSSVDPVQVRLTVEPTTCRRGPKVRSARWRQSSPSPRRRSRRRRRCRRRPRP